MVVISCRILYILAYGGYLEHAARQVPILAK